MKRKLFTRITSLLLISILLVGTFTTTTLAANANATQTSTKSQAEIKGVWISFLEFQTMLTGKTEQEFTKKITEAFDNIKNYGLNTVYVQVRPYSDALYPSKHFPWSHIATGVEGQNPGFDPLAIMVQEAHNRGLRIEAWINPYRVRSAGHKKPLSANSPAKKWLDAGDRAVISHSNGMISYNPADPKVQKLIVDGVTEIAQNYNVDGIHIDDYFYPVTGTSFDNEFDLQEYRSYTEKGGQLSHADWRRWNVETLLQKMYTGIKAVKPNVLFGISPQSSLGNNYNVQYLDVRKIASNKGYCDYIAPQIYFGFENGTQPFGTTLNMWNDIPLDPSVTLYVGIAAYKMGTVDSYAGNGVNEWANSTNRMATMVEFARQKQHYGGFILYRYDQVFRPDAGLQQHVNAENKALKEIL